MSKRSASSAFSEQQQSVEQPAQGRRLKYQRRASTSFVGEEMTMTSPPVEAAAGTRRAADEESCSRHHRELPTRSATTQSSAGGLNSTNGAEFIIDIENEEYFKLPIVRQCLREIRHPRTTPGTILSCTIDGRVVRAGVFAMRYLINVRRKRAEKSRGLDSSSSSAAAAQ